MKNLLRALSFLVMLLPGIAVAQCNSSTPLPINTVLGRLGITPGPCQAIPFATLSSNLVGTQPANKVNAGPVSGGVALPTFRSLVGADLPVPGASSLGGVQSLTCSTSNWFRTLSTSGVFGCSQPAFSDLTGSVAAAQMPALTGDVTTVAGSVATTIPANSITNAKAAQMAAYTVKGNATGSLANAQDLVSPILTSAQFGFTTAPNGTRIDARDSTTLTNNTSVYSESQRSVSSVTNDFVTTVNSVTANSQDAGTGRFVMRNFGTALSYPASTKGALTRALEAHTLVDSSIPNDANRGTWAVELGLHSQLAGNGADKNTGIYLSSSHTGWLSSGVRNDTGLLILGEDGWTNAIRYLDTNGTSILFNVDQNGSVTANAAVVGNLQSTNTTQLKGTQTNDNAAAGNYGEYVVSNIPVGSAVPLTTGTPANMTSLPLTAGDWDVSCNVYFNLAGTTNVTNMVTSLSQTSATLDFVTPGAANALRLPAFVPGFAVNVPLGPYRISLAAPTTVFCVAFSSFTVSTNGAYGQFRARRVR